MRYDIRMTGKKNIDAIIVTHNNEEIIFRGVQKVNGGNTDQELFEFLNEYFDSCSNEVLNKLWDLLKEGKTILEPGYFTDLDNKDLEELRINNRNYQFLSDKLIPVLENIYKIITPEDIGYAAQISGKCNPPKDLMAMSRLGDYPEETTIDNNKYVSLVKLAFPAQLTFPIVNQLLEHVSDMTGKEYKDAVAGKMISQISALTSLEGWKILDTYIRAFCMRQEARRNGIGVVSDVKYIDYIVYKGLFNKLCLTFLPSKLDGKNLSKELNSLVEGEIRGGSDVKFKTFKDPTPGSDDQSIPESYRIAQAVNGTDEIAQAEYFSFGMYEEVKSSDELGKTCYKWVKKTDNFFYYQCIGFGIKNQKLCEKVFNTLPRMWEFRLTNIHIKLLQLVFSKDISYYLFPALNYDQLMAAISLAQVKLFEMGFEHLATLCAVVRNPKYPTLYLDDNFKLTTKERDELICLCDVYEGQSVSTTENILVKSVMDFLDELGASGWDSNIEPGLLGNEKFVSSMSSGHLYQVDVVPEIKQELITLVKMVNTVEEENHE